MFGSVIFPYLHSLIPVRVFISTVNNALPFFLQKNYSKFLMKNQGFQKKRHSYVISVSYRNILYRFSNKEFHRRGNSHERLDHNRALHRRNPCIHRLTLPYKRALLKQGYIPFLFSSGNGGVGVFVILTAVSIFLIHILKSIDPGVPDQKISVDSSNRSSLHPAFRILFR